MNPKTCRDVSSEPDILRGRRASALALETRPLRSWQLQGPGYFLLQGDMLKLLS